MIYVFGAIALLVSIGMCAMLFGYFVGGSK